jgi:hypothetical protein
MRDGWMLYLVAVYIINDKDSDECDMVGHHFSFAIVYESSVIFCHLAPRHQIQIQNWKS